MRLLAALLVALFPIGPWAMVVVWRAMRRSPDVHPLRGQFVRFGLSSLQALGLAVSAANFLLGMPLSRGVDFVLLMAVLLLISGPPAIFLLEYYRP